MMKPDEILRYCLENLEGSTLVESWGEKGIFYNPGHVLKRGVYILTVKEKDGDNDKSSNLNRPGIFRVNLGVRKGTFLKLFGAVPKRPGADAEGIRKLDGAKISGYENYKVGKMTREAFLERKKALDARKQGLSAAVSELEAREIVEEAGKREYREAFRIQEYLHLERMMVCFT